MGRELLVLKDHNTLYGIWTDAVLEIQAVTECTPLPGNLACYEGLMNYKGNMVPVFSLSNISGNIAENAEKPSLMVFARSKYGVIGLQVSEVLDVINDEDETQVYDDLKLNNGVLRIERVVKSEEPVFVLDIDQILATVSGK